MLLNSTIDVNKYSLELYDRVSALPLKYNELFSQYENELFLSRSWFELFESEVVGRDGNVRVFCLVLASDPKVAMLLLPLWERRRCCGRVKTLSSLSNYYTGSYEPLYAKDRADLYELFSVLLNKIEKSREWHSIDLRSMVFDTDEYCAVVEALRDNHDLHQQYFMHGNWYLSTEKIGYENIVRSRPGVLRNTIKRKGKKFDQTEGASIEVLSGTEIDENRIIDYWRVYEGSWKSEESHKSLIEQLLLDRTNVRTAVLGLAYLDGNPIAAQLWIVCGSKSYIYKLAHIEKYSGMSIGTILLDRVMRNVCEAYNIHEVDFLTGDDAYKKQWMSARRETWGVVMFNKRTLSGSLMAWVHIYGQWIKRAVMKTFRA